MARETVGILLLLIPTHALAEGPADYAQDVKPLLQARCYACHGALKQEASLRLDTAKSLRQGGDSGPAVDLGAPPNSLLLERVAAEGDLRMPPEGEPLSPEQIAMLRRWIAAGAKAPGKELPQPDPRQHWAFKPPRPLDLTGDSPRDVDNVVDAYLAAAHARAGVTPVEECDPATLLRRLYLDLIGLPPSPESVAEFLRDPTREAYARVVDRLLASPAYGQRWGRHWMDIWRYADWSGEKNNQVRGSPRHIWRWRDWIVDSLNEDKGYDQMIREMLAGDELAPDDPATLRATGFLARNWYKFNRNVWLSDTVEHTSMAFLGLTFSCAKCHDHKYDPISQRDYYRLRAFFEPHDIRTDPICDEKDLEKNGLVRVFDAKPETPTYVFHRGDELQPDTSQAMKPGIPPVFFPADEPRPIEIPAAATDAPSGVSSGRRLALAEWITSKDNPLTARVAANHIWMRHFGRPLVEPVTDFGLRTQRPPLAPLLDVLAWELMQHDWSMKHLHRVVVSSRAYRMQSTGGEKNRKIDPDNEWFWRQGIRRMEGEVIRDSVLFLANRLDTTPGGPEIPLEQADESQRRSLYFRHGHERQVEFLQTFDGASVLECYRRGSTIAPQQALALANSVAIRANSRTIARIVDGANEADEAFVVAAFERILCRKPNASEKRRCISFLESQRELVAEKNLSTIPESPDPKVPASQRPRLRARESLVHVLLNHNDFVTIR